jgi:hypothetical protein
MKQAATISGDIVAFTSLDNEEKARVEKIIYSLFENLERRFNAYCRLIKGDYIECYIPNPQHALRAALSFKCIIKSMQMDKRISDRRFNKFKRYGIRLAIGIGTINRFDSSKGIIDGEAIYNSGRIINELKATHNPQRIVIKNTMFIKSADKKFDESAEVILELIDVLIRKATSKQSEVLYYKLLGYNENEIEELLPISQSTINTHSKISGWNAIDDAIKWFEKEVTKNN